ncbi:MAG: hypothetical protein R3E95_20745 [Thiolinea sp.]
MLSQFKSFLLLPFLGLVIGLAGCDAAIPQTQLDTAKAKADQCVEPTEDMRKNHMVYLDAHRDKTVIEGVRTKQHSLNECINCHVAPTRADGEALHYPDKEHFCASCHTYAGVKIDCFQCHADRPQVMEQPDYQHKLSANRYHQFSAGTAAPDANDLLLMSGAKGVTQ